MIGAEDTVTINGEDGIWEVDMAGNASPVVRVIRGRNAATWRMIDRADLTLVTQAKTGDDLPGFIPTSSIVD